MWDRHVDLPPDRRRPTDEGLVFRATYSQSRSRDREATMFGKDKMTHDGTAKVVSCQLHQGGWSKTDSHGTTTTKYDLIVDVYPEGAPPFRTEAQETFMSLQFPQPGDSLRARCNPEKQAVEIDISDDERFNPKLFRRASKARQEEQREQMLNAPPGTPTYAMLDPELAELAELDAEERKQDDG
jgi:hypothetical protein